MTRLLNWKEYLPVSLSLLLINLVNWNDPILSFIFGGLFLGFHALVFGNWLFIKNTNTFKFLIGLLFIISLIGLIGTICFYLFFLNDNAQAATLFIISLLGLFLTVKKPLIIEQPPIDKRQNPKIVALVIVYLLLLISICYLLVSSGTVNAIHSPWEVVPLAAIFLYFLATFCLFNIILFGKSAYRQFLVFLHYLISFSVAVIVYRIGFGYDPFIHRVNEQLILTNGTLLPKPFYYIGQYSLVVFLQKLLSLPLDWLDKILVPLLSAIYLPATVYYAFKDNFKVTSKILILICLTLLGLPFANFIATTPQALANLLLIITLLLSLYFLQHPKGAFWPLIILACYTTSIHPLAGIPCFIFVALVLVYHYFQKNRLLPKMLHHGIFWEVAIISTIALPFAFIINSQTLSQLKIGINLQPAGNFAQILMIQDWSLFYHKFISTYDSIYLYGKNVIPVILLLAAAGLLYVIKNEKFKSFFIYPLTSIILLANYLASSLAISFLSLISYEQNNYNLRILEMSLYFLLPFAVFCLFLFFNKILKQKRLFVFLTIILLSLALTGSFYLSYPRYDKYSENHGLSTSQSDIDTVNYIDQLNQYTPYVVLSAQTVAAAAIKELGYKHYYNDYFFYPVPTGGRLYQLYDELAYDKTKTEDVIATVRYLTGVNTVYFVINDYWWDAQTIIKQQKNKADEWHDINGKNFIFKYVK